MNCNYHTCGHISYSQLGLLLKKMLLRASHKFKSWWGIFFSFFLRAPCSMKHHRIINFLRVYSISVISTRMQMAIFKECK